MAEDQPVVHRSGSWGWAMLLALLTLVVWYWPQPRLAAPLAHPLLLPGEKAKAPAQGAALGLLLLALLLSAKRTPCYPECVFLSYYGH